MEFKQEENLEGGRFIIEIEGNEAGYIQYKWLENGNINANGTLVYDAYRDQKLGTPLFYKLVAFAKEKGIKIFPTCPFIVKTFQKHPELNDLLAKDYIKP